MVLSESNKQNLTQLSNIRTGLDNIASHSTRFLQSNSSLEISSKNVAFAATKTAPKDLTVSSVEKDGNLTISIRAKSTVSRIVGGDIMKIPSSVFKDRIQNISLFSFSFRQDTLFQGDTSRTTGSRILSTTVVNKKLANLTSPINITFNSRLTIENQHPNCSFWDETTGK